MKKIFTTICALTFSIQIYSQTTSLTWAKGMGGTLADVATTIATDANGNVYTAGYFSGTVDLDPGATSFTVSSNGGIDFYISKLDATGNFVWAKSIGGINNDFAYGIAIDGTGNLITTGNFGGLVDFDPNGGVSNLNSPLATGVYILKLDAAGNFVWAAGMYGNSYAYGQSVEVDASGNIYTAGLYSGVIDFDPGPSVVNLTVTGSTDFYVSKLNAAGNFVWAKSVGGSLIESANDIDVDAAGNIYTTGHFNGTVDFDPGAGSYTLSSQGANDIYISKWNSAGNFLWANAMGGTGNDSGTGIDVDNMGSVYVTGNFNGLVDFDPSAATYTLLSNGNTDCFITKVNSSGNFLWASQIGDASIDLGSALVLDASKSVYVSGKFQGTVDFDPSASSYTLASATTNKSDAFISKLDSLGNYVWAVGFGGSADDLSNAITIDASFNVYNCGSFGATADMDPSASTYTLLSAGSTDAFAHKMGQCIAPASPTNITPAPNLTVCIGNTTNLLVASTATVNWYSSLSSTNSIATGTNYNTPLLSSGTYTYFAEASTCTTSVQRTAISFSVIGCVTGINNLVAETDLIEIYPNPSTEILNIKLHSLTGQVSIQVINTLGEIVKQENITDMVSTLNTQDLSIGIYFLKIKKENNQQLIKFIKQ